MKKINYIRFFECGSETFNFSELFIKCTKGSVRLPINVIHFEHRKFGNMLINTGCTDLLKKNPAKYAKYTMNRNISFSKEDSIISQLSEEKIDPLLIKKVLLTHCSPECCGALPRLPRYELLSSAQVLCSIKLGTPENELLKSTLPSAGINIRAAGLYKNDYKLKKYFKFTYDLLGDGSVLGVDLTGHTSAMMGFYFPEYDFFYAADAAVDESVLELGLTPSEALLKLQSLPNDYLSNLFTLRHIYNENPDTKIMFLHSRAAVYNTPITKF